MSTRISSKKSKSWTAVKASPAPLDARWDLACGVVMMGRERRREDSTLASKWSLVGGVSNASFSHYVMKVWGGGGG